MMIDRIEGNAELKKSVRMMLDSRRMTHSLLLVGEEGLGAGFAARCVAADYLYPAGGAPAEALLRGECCRAVGKPGDRDSGRVETGIVREAISITGMGSGGRYLVSQVKAMRTEIFNTSLSAEGRAVLLYHVERMNEESANALLKVMEEPPEGVLFIMTADSLAGVLPTIRSRCISFAVAPVSPEACARYCTARGVEKKDAALYSELFDGHIGTVLCGGPGRRPPGPGGAGADPGKGRTGPGQLCRRRAAGGIRKRQGWCHRPAGRFPGRRGRRRAGQQTFPGAGRNGP